MSEPSISNHDSPTVRTSPPEAPQGEAAAPSGRFEQQLLGDLPSSWTANPPSDEEVDLLKCRLGLEEDRDVVSVVFEDFRQRSRRAQSASGDLLEQTPCRKDSLADLVPNFHPTDSFKVSVRVREKSRLPGPGECLFGFRLRRELGRGAFARVFLAEQTDLAGRPVVLKVSALEGSEPQTLAQLQHTHIVPIFSLHDDQDAGLRAMCMPYFGGATLAQALQALEARAPRPARGQELIAALDAVSAPGPEEAPAAAAVESNLSPRSVLGRLDYVKAVAWIGARLAEGLQHAHQRGVLHRDIKPQNILLGGDGQPMLLDFNLAQDDHGGHDSSSLGGTVAYMAPEHLRAVAARDPALARKVDRRSDLYSLGMVLYEMLAGRRPFECSVSNTPLPVLLESMAVERGRAVPSLRRVRADVPWGLESILRRCLAAEAERRYQHAEQLAEDLRRFIADDPLRYAPELSLAERARKWGRRHPRLSSAVAVFAGAALLLLAAGAALVSVREHLADTRGRLEAAQARDRRKAYDEGVTRALFLANTTSEWHDHLRQGIQACQGTLGLYGILDHDRWEEPADWLGLEPEDRRAMAENARELLLLLAGGRTRLAPRDNAALADALGLLDRAEAIPGLSPCRALWEDRAAYRDLLGDRQGAQDARERAAQVQPATAQEHYLLAMSFARVRQLDRAVRHLDEALRLNPRHYWCWAQRGLCHQERGELTLAAADLGTCVGLWPEFPWGYFNRAGILARCGKRPEAIADYTAALKYDADMVAAYVNRGLLHLEVEQYALALADFEQATRRGRDDAFLHSGRGVALEHLGRHGEANAAFWEAQQRAADLAPEARARLRWVYGFAICDRLPERAREVFEEVLREQPDNPQALYGSAMLLERQGRSAKALPLYNRAVEVWPAFVAARRARAVLLARMGMLPRATQEINDCLERDPQAGATTYAAACVAALIAQHSDGAEARRAADQALQLLEQAFARGYGLAQAGEDRDLDGIRQDPRFRQLLQNNAKR
jgi:serine/threonine protein kinase/Flp pilus assembly protein TadD